MESTGVINGCNIFQNWETLAALWAGALACNKTGFETKFYDNSLFISAIRAVKRKLTLQDKL